MVFDEVPQTQLSPLIPSTSDVTVTIVDEDWDEPEEDPDKTITPADFYSDEDALSVGASPMLCERLGVPGVCHDRLLLLVPHSPIFSDCPSLTSDHSSGDESNSKPSGLDR